MRASSTPEVAPSPRKDLERQQRRWAERAGVEHDSRGFVRDSEANLRVPMSAATRAAFARGTELDPRNKQPARIAALCSSAALVANVFDHWSARDAAPLVAALGLGADASTLAFEEPLPTGVEGDPPTSDVVLRVASGRVVAIESKFGEWLVRRASNRGELKPKYFPPGRELWSEAGLTQCQALARELRAGRERFKHLHAAQLLKHALGLARTAGGDFELRYLYYEWPCGPAAAHRDELERFARRVGAEARFSASTYQGLFRALDADARVDRAYVEYLRTRYFRAV